MIDATGPSTARVTVDFGLAHNLSIGQLKELQSKDIDGGTGAVSLVLSAGRILSPDIMDDDTEIAFVQAAMDWLGLYFAGTEGGIN